MKYTELQVTTNFSFLQGASYPHELIEQASKLGYDRIAITDRNTVAGIVRAHVAAKEAGINIIVGCRLDLLDGISLLAYPTGKAAYSRLTNLLTTGNLRAEKGKCHLYKQDVYESAEGIKFIAIPPDILNDEFDFDDAFKTNLKEYREAFENNLYLAATRRYHGDDQKQFFRLTELSKQYHIPLVATNDVYYHHPSRRQLQDILTCVREKCTIHNAGYKLYPNAERHLKSEAEMFRLFRSYPNAIERTQEIAQACTFSLTELKYQYPKELIPPGKTPLQYLEDLAWQGAKEIYGEMIPEKIINNINHEIAFIKTRPDEDYPSFFLAVWDYVQESNRRKILCQGRGSAANSTICFCLGVTPVNPDKYDLLFERFISAARNEPPDIDVDFEHERREEIIQYIYGKYGRDHAAIVATVTQQHWKGAIKDVGKAMGLSVDLIEGLSSNIWGYEDEWFENHGIQHQGLNPNDKHLKKVLELTREYIGFPRQLGQHTGGFVMTRDKLSDIVPILHARMENRTCIEWNKDDIDALGMMKMDVLGLGMPTCIRKAFELIEQHYGLNFTLQKIPQDDPDVYEMISDADTVGVFQIESRAQQSMLPRLRPKCFYDLVIEVAIVRPGPIQGDMVHPYLRRRNGEEAIEYPSKELEEILKRTLGVPLFQEQAMKIAIAAAGFTAAEADALRKSMATFKGEGTVTKFKEKLIRGMSERGYSSVYAAQVVKMLEGFGHYGFPESHAAAFASLVYASAWIKYHYPEVFACALLNSQPMGFYSTADIIRDAEKHGVKCRAIDINYSYWDNTLEEKDGKYHTLRLGFREIKGIREEDMLLLVSNRNRPFKGIHELRNIGLCQDALEKLADADAFRSIELDRREALWNVSTKDTPVFAFKGQMAPEERFENISLPLMTESEHVVQDFASTSFSIKAHPVSFLREKLLQLHVTPANGLQAKTNGDKIRVAGLVTVRQRPGTAKGVCFMTLQDETGYVNCVVFPNLFDEQRKEILKSTLILLDGHLQIEGQVIHVIVHRCYDISKMLGDLTPAQKQIPHPAPVTTPEPIQKNIQQKIFPDSRNFK